MAPPTPKLETLAVHAGQSPEPVTGAISTPIFLTSTYVQAGPGEHKGFEYSRTHNPTRYALEANLAALEGGRHGICFASGCAATTTVLHLLQAGDHVVTGDDLYGGTYRIFERVMRPFGLDFTYVDQRDPENFRRALRENTRLVWVESPSNPLLKLCDIEKVAALCRERGVWLAVDNTFMTPVLQRPLELGATLSVHSTTKYLNGHADVVGGAVITSDDALAERLRYLQNAIGAVPSPVDCFLVLRGVKTLALRMERHVQNARAVARWLEGDPLVERVLYPGTGGMISFIVKDAGRGALGRAQVLLRHLRLCACAESLGGVETLIDHPALMTHASVPREQREALGIRDGLLRLSVGIEHADDIIADLSQAFRAAG